MSTGFNFGQPTSTGASSGSLFGTAPKTDAQSGGLFGGNASTASPFGTSNTANTTPSLFSGAPSGISGSGSTSLFGQSAGGAGGSNLFGKQAENNKTGEQPKPSIFGQSTSQPPATPSGNPPTLFGSTTPATTTGGFTFGNSSTTPAGPPPQPNAFGASTGGGGIFGNLGDQNKSEPSKQPSLSFGTPAASTLASQPGTTQAQSTTSLFSSGQTGASSLFNAKPADQTATTQNTGSTTQTSKPTLSFGAPAGTTAGKTTSLPSLFGTASTGSAPVSSASQPTTSLFSSAQPSSTQAGSTGALFGKPAPAATTTTSLFSQGPSTSAEATSKAPFSFGVASSQPSTSGSLPAQKPLFGTTTTSSTAPSLTVTPATVTTAQSTSATTTTAPAAGLFSLGKPTAPPTAPTTTTNKSGGLFSLGGTTGATSTAPATTNAPATSTVGTSTLGAFTAGPMPPAQSRLRNKTLDEILTRWATDLTRYTKDFKTQAETIAQWDQIIVDNSSKIDKLYVKTRTCEKQTMSVEMQLAAVENQQNELESWLSKYEGDVEDMLAKDNLNAAEVGGPDQERERTYKLAEKLNERLEDMGRDLESMVEQVNAANASLSKHTKADEPITQIVRILNSHLTQLQQIDQGTAALQAKVSSAQKAANHLGYLNGGASGEGRAAVEDFYKSYMGRR